MLEIVFNRSQLKRSFDVLQLGRIALCFLSMAIAVEQTALAVLVPENTARQAGLTRAWYTQAQVDTSRHELTGAKLEGTTLFILTSAGQMQALDAETGKIKWSSRVGEPEQPSYGPAAHGNEVALISGSTLFVLDATNGKEILSRRVDGAPGGGPELSDDFVYAPLATGQLQAYALDSKPNGKWQVSSAGNIFTEPVIVEDQIVWVTSKGYLYSAYASGKGINFRFDAADRLVAPVALHEKTILVASAGGNLYCLDSRSGRQRWRSSVGVGVLNPAVALNGVAYVGTEDMHLYAFDASNGTQKWIANGVDALVSASKDKIYGVGKNGNLAVLQAETGEILSFWPGPNHLTPVQNKITDRLYFVSSDGLIQCFHEIGADKPHYHGTPPVDVEAAMADEKASEPVKDDAFESDFANPQADEPADEVDPFAGGLSDEEPEASVEDEADPFGGDLGDDDLIDDDDPFADF